MNMYKGYLKTKGKVPLEKMEEMRPFPPERGDYAGVLADDMIQIDVDNKAQAEIVHAIVNYLELNCNVLQTTRGLHFYFKNPAASGVKNRSVKAYTPVGIKIDVGVGLKNSLVPLVVNGTAREWLNQTEEPDELPDWLRPVKITPVNWFSLGEGDGRNQELFNYIVKLQSAGLAKESIVETINLINKFILKTPLAQREIDTITRDEAFPTETFFSERGKFLHDGFARWFMNNEHVVRINGLLHIYRHGLYTNNWEVFERKMLDKIPTLTSSQRNEVLRYIQVTCDSDASLAEARFVGLKSKIYDIETDSLLDYTPKIVLKNRIPYDYDPATYDRTVDLVFGKITCKDANLRLLLEEMIGYCLYRKKSFGKTFFLTAGGENGKSTFLDMIKTMLGRENIATLEPADFEKRFVNAQLFGKLANIGDDISSNYRENSSIFKKLVTGESIMVENKGETPFMLDNYATLVFCTNEMPRINDQSHGFMRRLIIIPFNARFSVTDPDYDPFIKDKLLTETGMKYLLKLAVDGLKRLLKNKRFTNSAQVSEQLKLYESINNPVLLFVESHQVENQIARDVYLQYSSWCRENGLSPVSNINFGRILSSKNLFKTVFKKVDGKSFRIYAKIQEA
ncbi:hypothetical protein SPTER_27500 [Sporomusa termitida]|uniref:SF3 helicase domain-containing protein n=2 Tax=Sporomusa termitida TaxID=2377 RepID=A0A517DVL0_9FIRM|nr:hypothetical protein SPTER_27500 [Sporomusa termitida]